MTPEDRISVHKFTNLVEKCNSKEEILDLCEKALQKYRPKKFESVQDFSKESMHVLLTRKTYFVRAKESIDRYALAADGPGYEAATMKHIGMMLGQEVFRNNLIKYESYEDIQMNTKIYVGTLEVVVP